MQEEAGHLLDIEPLMSERLDQLISGAQVLSVRDGTNEATWKAQRKAKQLADILLAFRQSRQSLVRRFDALPEEMVEQAAHHPRLNEPMRVIDLALFIVNTTIITSDLSELFALDCPKSTQSGILRFFFRSGINVRTDCLVISKEKWRDFDERARECQDCVAEGDRVLVVGFERGRVKATNRTFEGHWVMAFTIRNGKVTNLREYVDTLAMARTFEMVAEFDPVREFGEHLRQRYGTGNLDSLVNNAGIMALPKRTLNSQGLELQMATIYFGPSLLTALHSLEFNS